MSVRREPVTPVPEVAPAFRNLVDGRVHLVGYDAAWPDHFEQEARKIRAALGDAVLRLEHVGSTSIPGLDAKPCIDILLVVVDSSDEAAYGPALTEAGYRLVIREPDWHQHRVYKGPEINLNLHVFSEGSSEIERLLLFRDHLRANPQARGRYVAAKRGLAERTWDTIQDYADAKSEVIEKLIEDARSTAS